MRLLQVLQERGVVLKETLFEEIGHTFVFIRTLSSFQVLTHPVFPLRDPIYASPRHPVQKPQALFPALLLISFPETLPKLSHSFGEVIAQIQQCIHRCYLSKMIRDSESSPGYCGIECRLQFVVFHGEECFTFLAEFVSDFFIHFLSEASRFHLHHPFETAHNHGHLPVI